MNRTPDSPPGHGFPPSARLHSPPEYQQAFSEGRRHHGQLFRMHFRADPDGPVRLGVSVSKRVDKRAVGRNRVKRVCRDAFRSLASGLPHGDIVLVARPEAAKADNAAIRDDLQRLFAKLVSLKPTAAPGTMTDSASAATPPSGADRVDPSADS